jgi:hypothetical protein
LAAFSIGAPRSHQPFPGHSSDAAQSPSQCLGKRPRFDLTAATAPILLFVRLLSTGPHSYNVNGQYDYQKRKNRTQEKKVMFVIDKYRWHKVRYRQYRLSNPIEHCLSSALREETCCAC